MRTIAEVPLNYIFIYNGKYHEFVKVSLGFQTDLQYVYITELTFFDMKC